MRIIENQLFRWKILIVLIVYVLVASTAYSQEAINIPKNADLPIQILLKIESGNDQFCNVDASPEDYLVVKAVNKHNAVYGIEGVDVTFTIVEHPVGSTGLLSPASPATVTTTSAGTAFVQFTTGNVAGIYKVRATAEIAEIEYEVEPLEFTVNVYKVMITTADVTVDQIVYELGPIGTEGTIQIDLVGDGNGDHNLINSENRIGLEEQYIQSFDIDNLPENQKFHQVRVLWDLDECTIEEVFDFPANRRLHVLGMYEHTQYNTPTENDCGGTPSTACITDTHCNYTEVEMLSGFVPELFENGSGVSNDYGALQWGDYCWRIAGYPRPENCAFARTFGQVDEIVGSGGDVIPGQTVAIHENHPILNFGDQIFANNIGELSVSDLCPVCNDDNYHHIDHYGGESGCNDVFTICESCMTIKFY